MSKTGLPGRLVAVGAGTLLPASGAGGLYQFLPSTWQSLGYSGLPQDAPVSVQNAAFQQAYAQSGTSPWAPSEGADRAVQPFNGVTRLGCPRYLSRCRLWSARRFMEAAAP